MNDMVVEDKVKFIEWVGNCNLSLDHECHRCKGGGGGG